MVFRVSLLGEQAIGDDVTGEVRSRSQRTVALIGYLALHAPAPQSRQLIAGLFWPESTDAQALTNLRRELHHLRQLLGSDRSLEVTARDLRWHDTVGCRVDVRLLRISAGLMQASFADGDLVSAGRYAWQGIEEYGGDFLPAVYDEWAVQARDDLRRECVALCDALAGWGSRAGDLRTCVEAARRRIVMEPLEEVGYRTLMELQMKAGDRAGAISTYHHCASVLKREMGVAPGPATREGLQRLLGAEVTGEPDLDASEALPRGPSIALVGRERSLQALVDQWHSTVSEERAHVVVVRGHPGVGKTRLVTELADRVRAAGGSVATTQCFDGTGRLALAPVAEWLRHRDLRRATRSLDEVWRTEVARLLPQPFESHGDNPVLSSGGRAMVDAWQQHRFYEGLARAFLAVPRPMLLVLDNLQWCDAETLAWISFVLGLAPGHRLMIAMTLREDAPQAGSPVLDWLSRLRTGYPVEDILLAPLDRDVAAVLSAEVTGTILPADQAVLLHATTGGFPLFVIEAARAKGDLYPAGAVGGLLGVLCRRIAQTTPNAQQTAALAAAVGQDFVLDVLTEASDLDADTVAQSVDELWRRGILRERGAGYDFSHDLLRDAAYSMVSPARRWLLHRRLAQALELSAGGGEETLSGLLAEQYDRGGRPRRALPHYRRAAEVAAARFAPAEAIRLLREALRVVGTQLPGGQRDRDELECLLAMAAPLNALHGYASPDLREVLIRAVYLAEEIGPGPMVVSATMGLWASSFVQGDVLESQGLAARALALSGGDDVLLGEAHFACAGSATTLGHPAEAVEHFDQAHDRCRGAESLAVGSMPEVHALAWAAHAHWLLGEPDLAAERATEAVSRARSLAHPYSLAVALAYGAITGQLLDDREAMSVTVHELDELCERYGFAYYREWGLVLGGWLLGDAEGLSKIDNGIENLRRQLSNVRMPYWLALKAEVLEHNGRREDASATLDAARAAAGTHGDAWWLPEIERARAWHASPERRSSLLQAALRLAQSQGSRALAERCLEDLQPTSAGFRAPFARWSADPNAAGTLGS